LSVDEIFEKLKLISNYSFSVQVTATARLPLMKKPTTNRNLIAQGYGMDQPLVDTLQDLPMLLMNLPELQ